MLSVAKHASSDFRDVRMGCVYLVCYGLLVAARIADNVVIIQERKQEINSAGREARQPLFPRLFKGSRSSALRALPHIKE